VKENVNPTPEAADDAALARALFEKGVLDEADLEVEQLDGPAPLAELFADFRLEPL
jgi:hypothetical protein